MSRPFFGINLYFYKNCSTCNPLTFCHVYFGVGGRSGLPRSGAIVLLELIGISSPDYFSTARTTAAPKGVTGGIGCDLN